MNDPSSAGLAETIAEKIRQMINDGRLQHTLPGERELGHRLSVGRETVRKALIIMEQNGDISAPRLKTPRKILRPASHPCRTVSSGTREIGFLTSRSLQKLPQSAMVELYTLSKIMEEDDISIRIHDAPWLLGPNPDKRLTKLVEQSGCACWILHRTSEQTQIWFKKHGIPCIVRGSAYPSSSLPYLDKHWVATTNHAARYLWSKGHKTVGLCLPPDPLKGHQLMQKGFFEFQGQGWTPVLIPSPMETPAFFENLTRVFAQHPDMSALVAARGNQTVALFSWAEMNSMIIPDQLSLLSLSYEPFMDRLLPSVAYYNDNLNKTVHKLVRMLRGIMAGRRLRSLDVIPELHEGQSVVRNRHSRPDGHQG